MWKLDILLLSAFMAMSDAIKSNSSLLESKIQLLEENCREVQNNRFKYVLSYAIRQKTVNSAIIYSHLCVATVLTKKHALVFTDCTKPGFQKDHIMQHIQSYLTGIYNAQTRNFVQTEKDAIELRHYTGVEILKGMSDILDETLAANFKVWLQLEVLMTGIVQAKVVGYNEYFAGGFMDFIEVKSVVSSSEPNKNNFWVTVYSINAVFTELDLGSLVLVSNQPVGVVTGISDAGEMQSLLVLKLWNHESVPNLQV